MQKKLVIIIPALNEEATIADVVQKCLDLSIKDIARQSVIVVDDGSTDQTLEAAQTAGANVVSHSSNCGVGRAFRTGVKRAMNLGADIIVNIDADGQFDPARIPDLIRPILDDQADFVTASRFKDRDFTPHMPRIKIFGNIMMSRLVSKITKQTFHDVSCGFRAYSIESALRLNLYGDFTYTQETFLDMAVKCMRIVEMPMHIRGERETGTSRVAGNLWKYGYKAINIILHSYRDFWPMQFFGFIALLFILPGVALLMFLSVHRILSGSFSPHIWSGFTGGGLIAMGGLTLVTGLIGETLKRIRLNQELLLYYQRKHERRAQTIQDK